MYMQLSLAHRCHLQFMAFVKLVLLLVHLDSLSSCTAYLKPASSSVGLQHFACEHECWHKYDV